MHRLKSLALVTLVLLLASACGLRGPLYLPETEEPPSAVTGEESEQKKDKDEDGKNTRT